MKSVLISCLTLAALALGNPALAAENACSDAGLTGRGFGLCTAYCEAMDCGGDDPQADPAACAAVRDEFLAATGLVELPCDGAGEPPPAEAACPCDFDVEAWRSILAEYDNQECGVISRLTNNGEFWALNAYDGIDVSPTSGVSLYSNIFDDDDRLVKGYFACAAIDIDYELLTERFSPRPFGFVQLSHGFEGERIPEQTGFYEACAGDLEALRAELFPTLVCEVYTIFEAVVTAVPESGDSPLEVSFSVELFGDSVPPYTYLWDFGDGTTSTEMNPTHTFVFDTPGIFRNYRVDLEVMDGDGQVAWGSVDIRVYGPPL